MANEWHYSHDGRRHGPVSGKQLKQLAVAGELKLDDLVWKEGMPEWKPASKINGLFITSSHGQSPTTMTSVHSTTEAPGRGFPTKNGFSAQSEGTAPHSDNATSNDEKMDANCAKQSGKSHAKVTRMFCGIATVLGLVTALSIGFIGTFTSPSLDSTVSEAKINDTQPSNPASISSNVPMDSTATDAVSDDVQASIPTSISKDLPTSTPEDVPTEADSSTGERPETLNAPHLGISQEKFFRPNSETDVEALFAELGVPLQWEHEETNRRVCRIGETDLFVFTGPEDKLTGVSLISFYPPQPSQPETLAALHIGLTLAVLGSTLNPNLRSDKNWEKGDQLVQWIRNLVEKQESGEKTVNGKRVVFTSQFPIAHQLTILPKRGDIDPDDLFSEISQLPSTEPNRKPPKPSDPPVNRAMAQVDPASDLAILIAEACVEALEKRKDKIKELEEKLVVYKASRGGELRGRGRDRYEELTESIETSENKIAQWKVGNLDILQNSNRELSLPLEEGSFGQFPESFLVRKIIDGQTWVAAYTGRPSFSIPIVEDSIKDLEVGQEVEINHPICFLHNSDFRLYGSSRLVGYVVPEEHRAELYQEVRRLVVQHYVGVPLNSLHASDNEILERVLGPVQNQVNDDGMLSGAKVMQILDSGVLVERFGRIWMLQGIATVDLADGDPLSPMAVTVTGTATYTTVLNATNTVYTLELLDSDDKQQVVKQFRERLQHSLQSKIKEVDRILAEQDRKHASKRAAQATQEQSEHEEAAMAKFRAAQLFEKSGNERLRDKQLEEIFQEYAETEAAELARDFQARLSQPAD